MKEQTAVLFLVLAAAAHATDVRLRDGDFTTTYRVAAGTTGAAGAPIRLQLRNYAGAISHALADGETVFVQNVAGCVDANGFRRVSNANASAGTLTLTDLANNPITCSAVWVNNYEGARIGKATTYTLPAHPRVVAPPSGTLNTRVNGTAGPAPIVTANYPAWQALTSRYGTGGVIPAFDAGCDGVTPALCPNAEARMSSADLSFGYSLPGLALYWYADQTGAANGKYPAAAARLSSVLYWLNHIERLPAKQEIDGPMNYGLEYLPAFGHGSVADWVSLLMFGASTAYSQVRSQMTPAQRIAFANKMLNGIEADTSCINSPPIDTGNTVSTTGGSAAITASGGLSAFSPGDWILVLGSVNQWNTGNFEWRQIASVTDDTHATLKNASNSSRTNAAMFRAPLEPAVFQAWSGNECGLAALANMHGYTPGYAAVTQVATSSANYGATATSIVLNADGAAITLTPPFLLENTHGEIMRVTARSGNTLTVVRNLYGSGSFGVSQNEALLARRWRIPVTTAYPYVLTGDWQQNLTLNKQVGFIAAGLALADDDPRAATLLENAVNYYHDYTLFDLERSATIRMQGGLTGGYQMGRWGNMTAEIASMLAGIGYNGAWPAFLRRYVNYPLYLMWPGQTKAGPGEDWSTEFPKDLWWVSPLQYYAAGTPEQKYIRYWHDTLNGWNTAGTWQGPAANWGIFWRLLFADTADAAADYRAALNPWIIATTVDNPASPYPYGTIVSKKAWTGGSYLVVNANNLVSDHDPDVYHAQTDYIASYGSSVLISGDAPGFQVWGLDAAGNGFEIGGNFAGLRIGTRNWNEVNPSAEGGDVVVTDEAVGNTTYVSARLNFKGMWKSALGLTRAYRYFDHLKDGPEYIVVFDDVASSAANQKRTRLHYSKVGDAATALTGGGTASLVCRKPTQGTMVSTRLLFPDGAQPSITHAASTYANNETIDWGATTAAQMIAVHRLAGNVLDTVPATSLATADANSVAAEIDDGNLSWTLVYPKAGNRQTTRSVTTKYAGNGRALIHGLAPGAYRVLQDGAVTLTGLSAGGDGTLSFPANGAHTFTVQQEKAGVAGLTLVNGRVRVN